MKATFFAAAAAMAGAASAANHRHAHQMYAKRGHAASTGFPVAGTTGEMCMPGCTTIWKTITGEPTLVPIPVTTVTSTSTDTSTVTVTPTPTQVVETTTVVVVPTPEVNRCPTTGVYTFPAKTMTVTDTTTVCGATSTKVPAGTHTMGGVTTVVTTMTTVTCPVATVETTGDVTTSTIRMTEYVCPSAGTYTIGAHTTACETETVVVYPTATTIVPGTYTKPEVVVTATETDYVTVCPYTSSGLPTTTATPVPATTPASVSTPAAVSTPESAPSSSAATPSASTPAAPSTGGDDIRGTNDHYAITYTPYESKTGQCKSKSEVQKDINDIHNAGFQAVRIYGTDCNTLENVVPACVEKGIQIIAGIFVKPGQQCCLSNPEIKKQVDDLNNMDQWDAVRLLVVGNESIMNGICTAQELAKLITDVKAECPKYKGLCTIAETLNIYQQKEVAETIVPLVDVCGANIHAFFNPEITADQAGTFVENQMDILKKICNKNVINLETGWKNGGSCNGKACPGVDDQKKAIGSIRQKVGDKCVFFSYTDDLWKPKPDQDWGLQSVFNFAQ